jgi:hypothetical protein
MEDAPSLSHSLSRLEDSSERERERERENVALSLTRTEAFLNTTQWVNISFTDTELLLE